MNEGDIGDQRVESVNMREITACSAVLEVLVN